VRPVSADAGYSLVMLNFAAGSFALILPAAMLFGTPKGGLSQ
jgi:hypothetical protein